MIFDYLAALCIGPVPVTATGTVAESAAERSSFGTASADTLAVVAQVLPACLRYVSGLYKPGKRRRRLWRRWIILGAYPSAVATRLDTR